MGRRRVRRGSGGAAVLRHERGPVDRGAVRAARRDGAQSALLRASSGCPWTAAQNRHHSGADAGSRGSVITVIPSAITVIPSSSEGPAVPLQKQVPRIAKRYPRNDSGG